MNDPQLRERIETILATFETKTHPIDENTGAQIICSEEEYCNAWDDAVNELKNIAAAPALLEALKYLTDEINLSKLNIRKDFSLINAHANALKAISLAEGNQ